MTVILWLITKKQQQNGLIALSLFCFIPIYFSIEQIILTAGYTGAKISTVLDRVLAHKNKSAKRSGECD